MEKIAPVNNAGKMKKPMFIVQGKNDPRVPLTEAEQMVATLKKQGTPVWYLMAKDEGHGFAKKKNADYQFYSTVLFMQEHLLKCAEPDLTTIPARSAHSPPRPQYSTGRIEQ